MSLAVVGTWWENKEQTSQGTEMEMDNQKTGKWIVGAEQGWKGEEQWSGRQAWNDLTWNDLTWNDLTYITQ